MSRQDDEKWMVAKAMTTYGGAFVKKLGDALYHADRSNALRIKRAFPEYWGKYLDLYKINWIDSVMEND